MGAKLLYVVLASLAAGSLFVACQSADDSQEPPVPEPDTGCEDCYAAWQADDEDCGTGYGQCVSSGLQSCTQIWSCEGSPPPNWQLYDCLCPDEIRDRCAERQDECDEDAWRDYEACAISQGCL